MDEPAGDAATGLDPERARLAGGDAEVWRRWGPYLSERAWGTVREGHSPHGTAWEALPHDDTRSRAYRRHEGNHGEDTEELWWYRDATPTHGWSRWQYAYPQAAFPYDDLVATNADRGRDEPEYELLDTGVFGHGDGDVAIDALVERCGRAPRGPSVDAALGTGVEVPKVPRVRRLLQRQGRR